MESHGLMLPVENPVLVFALVMLIVLVAPLVFRRMRIPGLVGLIVAGVVFGPYGLGVLARDETMELLGTVGLLYIMFVAGLEIDLNQFNRYRRRSLSFSALTYGLPQVLGTMGGVLLLGMSWPASILLGSIIASHTLVAYPIVSRLGLARNEAVTTAVGATIITDSLALFVLAVIAGSAEGDVDLGFWIRLIGLLAVYVAAVFLLVPRVGRWFFRRQGQSDGVAGFVFVLAAVFTTAYLAELAGVEAIIGAFLAGLALNRLVPEQGTLMNRISFVGDSLFIPFFLLSVGMLVNVRAFAGSLEAWTVAGVILTSVLLAKGLAAFGTRWMFGYTTSECWLIFGLTVSQAAATLAAVMIGVQIGLLDGNVLNATILMILVTCLVGPWLAERYGRRAAMAEAQKPFDPSQAPQRILVPLTHPDRVEELMELALLLREERSEQPIYPLTVVRDRGDVRAQVVGTEKLQSLTVRHGSAVEVPVLPLTRVGESVPDAIRRAVAEERITTVVIGWDGQNLARQHVFGSVIDELLEVSRELVLICDLKRPINTIERVVVVAPPFIDREPGFLLAIRAVHVLTNRIGARLVIVATADAATVLEPTLQDVRPRITPEFVNVPEWSILTGTLDDTVGPADLLVVLGVRSGSLAWRPAMDRLPKVVAGRFTLASQVFVYLSEIPFATGDVEPAAGASDHDAGHALIPEHIHLTPELRGSTWGEVLDALLRPVFGEDEEAIMRTEAALLDWRSGYAPERQQGIALLHAHVQGLAQPVLHVGLSPDGIRLPGMAHLTHAVFVLLAPEVPTSDAYLDRLASIAESIPRPDSGHELLSARSASDVRQALTGRMAASQEA